MLEQPTHIIFYGNEYTISKPTDWLVKSLDMNKIMFIGPKIGLLHVSFFIQTIEDEKITPPIAAKNALEKHQTNNKFTILSQKEYQGEHYKALLRHSAWHDTIHDITIFSRQVYTKWEDKTFVLSSSLPNTQYFKEFDQLLLKIIGSFRFRHAKPALTQTTNKANTESIENVELNKLQGYHFQLSKPNQWEVFSTAQYQVIINGPVIDMERPNICVQIENNKNINIQTFVNEITLGNKENRINYKSNQPIFTSKGNLQIGQKLANWLNPQTGKVVFQRFVFIKKQTTFFIFSASQPEHPDFDIYDKLFLKILNNITIRNAK